LKNPDPSSFLVCSIFLLWYDGIAIKKRVDVFEAKGVRMTRKYRLERTAFIGCRNTAYMDVDDDGRAIRDSQRTEKGCPAVIADLGEDAPPR